MSICKVYIVLALALMAASCKAPTVSNPQTENNPPTPNKAWVVSTLAGTGSEGFADGAGSEAQFSHPHGVAVDSSGNVYVADTFNHRIRKITITEDSITVSTLTGTGAQFNLPTGVAVDSRNGNVYVADYNNHRIRKITAGGAVSTLAGSGARGFANGAGSSARFSYPYGVAVGSSGNIYVADCFNHRIRKVTEDGVVSTLAGSGAAGHKDGAGNSVRFNYPTGVAVDSSGNVYVADWNNHRIRKVVTAEDGVVTVSTLAGSGEKAFADGAVSSAKFYYPYGVAVDSFDNVYVADQLNNRIRKIEYRVP